MTHAKQPSLLTQESVAVLVDSDPYEAGQNMLPA